MYNSVLKTNKRSSYPCPCKNCGDREVGCHGSCEAYRSWRAHMDERNNKIRNNKNKHKEYHEYRNSLF